MLNRSPASEYVPMSSNFWGGCAVKQHDEASFDVDDVTFTYLIDIT